MYAETAAGVHKLQLSGSVGLLGTHTLYVVHHLLMWSSETPCSTCPIFMAESGKNIAVCQTERERECIGTEKGLLVWNKCTFVQYRERSREQKEREC